MSLNLEKQLRFYGAYHHNPVNIAVHVICVPLILWTFFLLASNSPNVIPTPEKYTYDYLRPNIGTLACLLYSTLYVLMEPVAGSAFAVLLFASTAFANHLVSRYGMTVNYWAMGAHVVCWLAQFVGHGVYEGRAPALLDNLFQAVFLAPLFIWLEVLFTLGYRPELKSKLERWAKEDIAKWKANGKANSGPVTPSQTSNGHAKSG